MPTLTYFDFLKQAEAGKTNFPIIFIYGYNEFLGEQILRTCVNKFIENKSDFNYRRYYFDNEGGADWEEVISEANSANFFVRSRKILVITIREEKYLSINKADLQTVRDYLQKPNPSTTLIIYLSLDLNKDDYKQLKKNKLEKLEKEFQSPSTTIIDLDRITEREIKTHIHGYLKASGVTITESALDKIIEIKDDDIISILAQLPRLAITETEGQGIDSSDIDKMITGVEAHSIWDLTDAIEAENTARYLRVLRSLFMGGIKPTLIIGTLITHYNKLFVAKFLLKRRTPTAEIGKLLSQSSYFLNKFIESARRFPEKKLQRILELIYKLDYESKTTGDASSRISLESFAFRVRLLREKQGGSPPAK